MAIDIHPIHGSLRLVYTLSCRLGFKKGYNFILFFISFGAMIGFCLARLPYLNFYGVFCGNNNSDLHAAPGECWHYLSNHHETIGIILHLAAIIPGSFLASFQFIPVIRHKAIILHRWNGYLVLILSLIATAGAFIIIRHTFGGRLETQMVTGLLGILFIGSLTMGYINIKRLQVEQHRAWMLRAWFYAGSVITLRLIMAISAKIISNQFGYYDARQCGQIDYIFKGDQNAVTEAYPDCVAFYSGANLDQWVLVHADMGSRNAAEIAAALGISFGTAGWLAFAIHAIGVEVYLNLTPAQHEHLRNVSYWRQLEAGFNNPGSAGLTVDRLGDAKKWVPEDRVERELSHSSSVIV